jgi:hypothetical protein
MRYGKGSVARLTLWGFAAMGILEHFFMEESHENSAI